MPIGELKQLTTYKSYVLSSKTASHRILLGQQVMGHLLIATESITT